MPTLDYSGPIPIVTYTISGSNGRTVTSILTLTMPPEPAPRAEPPPVRGTPTFYRPYEHPYIEMAKFRFKPVILDFNGLYGGINQFSLPHGETTRDRDAVDHSNHTPYYAFDRFSTEAEKAKRDLEDNARFSEEIDPVLRNALPPPVAKLDAEGKVSYTLPKATFAGGKGEIKLAAFTKDGKPLPQWITFNPNTGAIEVFMPDDMNEAIEIDIVATDDRGDRAQTTVVIKPSTDKVQKTAFIGKSSLSSQIKSAVMFGGGRS